jgi:hypothetical protein
MIGHKFAVGQYVDYDRKLTPSPRPAGPYEVTRVLPAENAETQTYRIKSKAEPFERSAKEYEIVAVEPAVSEMTESFATAAASAAHRRH